MSKNDSDDLDFKEIEFSDRSVTGVPESSEFFIHKDFKKRLSRKLTFLDRKGINAKLLLGALVLIAVAGFSVLVVIYSYNAFKNTATLLAEVNELENAFLEVQLLTRVRNETIGSMSTRSYLGDLQKILGISNKPGDYRGISLSGRSRDILDLLEMIVNEPRMMIKKLELRSNLGFPILPESTLPSNIMIELRTDVSITGSF
ncbi:MAG TPA: hypothetical protein PKY42_06545 [Mesotoga sp.]|nr:hypothetical protein [Mesotoga sp.]HOI64092.1 hypothetical protein [Mesotoga sp.]HPB64022.1 hypothetical protein [Mesotoga sp.]HPX22804.1 hypothetical protein [Mesotoga sp.]HQQ56224.1 hypothetical protein [Mesotoga sp.]